MSRSNVYNLSLRRMIRRELRVARSVLRNFERHPSSLVALSASFIKEHGKKYAAY